MRDYTSTTQNASNTKVAGSDYASTTQNASTTESVQERKRVNYKLKNFKKFSVKIVERGFSSLDWTLVLDGIVINQGVFSVQNNLKSGCSKR